MASLNPPTVLSIIQHYQRSIDSCQDDEDRLLHCVSKLYKLPVKVEHLQETGIGKTVNSLRRLNGEIGVAAKTLITKWKAMVAAEEQRQQHQEESTDVDGGQLKSINKSANEQYHDRKQKEMSGHQQHFINQQDMPNITHNLFKLQNQQHHHRGEDDRRLQQCKEGEIKGSSSSSVSVRSRANCHKHYKKSNLQVHSDEPQQTATVNDISVKDKLKNQKEIKAVTLHHKSRHHQNHDQNRHHSKLHSTFKSTSESELEKVKTEAVVLSMEEGDILSVASDMKHLSNNSKPGKIHSKVLNTSIESEHHKKSLNTDCKQLTLTKESRRRDSSCLQCDEELSGKRNSNGVDFIKPQQPKINKLEESQSKIIATSSLSLNKLSLSDHGSTLQKRKLALSTGSPSNDGSDGFDSSSGANFADVLDMLNIPTKKLRKSNKALSSSSTTTSPVHNANSLGYNKGASSISLPLPSVSSLVNKTGTSTSSCIQTNRSNNLKNSIKVNGPSIINNKFNESMTSSNSSMASSTAKVQRPDLLAPTVKLAPLDLSIAMDLPTISNNYKPMPLNSTIIDCVFQGSAPASSVKTTTTSRTLSDSEAIQHGISSKSIRTKIYSGSRSGQSLQVPSLMDICIRVLQKNIDAVEYTGGVPYELLKPVLDKATPQQLLTFETHNSYLMQDTDELWQMHAQRKYRTQRRLENEAWREMFLRCQKDEERKLNYLADTIKQSQRIATAPVRKTQLAFVDAIVKPPRNILRKQEQFGTKAKLVATPASRVASLSTVIPNIAKPGDTRLKVACRLKDNAQISNNRDGNSSGSRPTKKAPLMQKTLQFIRGRHRR